MPQKYQKYLTDASMGNVLMNSTLACRLNYDISQIIQQLLHEPLSAGSEPNIQILENRFTGSSRRRTEMVRGALEKECMFALFRRILFGNSFTLIDFATYFQMPYLQI